MTVALTGGDAYRGRPETQYVENKEEKERKGKKRKGKERIGKEGEGRRWRKGIFRFFSRISMQSLDRRNDLGVALADKVTGRVVRADDVGAPVRVALLEAASDLCGGLPDDLGEVVVDGTARAVVVAVTFRVPCVDRAGGGVAQGQVFTVLAAGVGQGARAVVGVCVVLCVGGEGIIPGQAGDAVERSLGVVFGQDLGGEVGAAGAAVTRGGWGGGGGGGGGRAGWLVRLLLLVVGDGGGRGGFGGGLGAGGRRFKRGWRRRGLCGRGRSSRGGRGRRAEDRCVVDGRRLALHNHGGDVVVCHCLDHRGCRGDCGEQGKNRDL